MISARAVGEHRQQLPCAWSLVPGSWSLTPGPWTLNPETRRLDPEPGDEIYVAVLEEQVASLAAVDLGNLARQVDAGSVGQ